MPIPFLLGALALGAGAVGLAGHSAAKETNQRAQRRAQDAQNLYNNAKYALESAKGRTESTLIRLGSEKKHILDTSMNQFATAYEKVQHIRNTESVGIQETANFMISSQEMIEIKQMTDIYADNFASGAVGAIAGVGALATVGGGLAIAAAPLAMIAAPIMIFTGISASMRADENLEKANEMYAEAEMKAEQMGYSQDFCEGITNKTEMYLGLLTNLNEMFSMSAATLAGLVKKKEGGLFGRFFKKKKLNREDFTENEIKIIAVAATLAKAVKTVIDTPMLTDDGYVSQESEEVYEATSEKLIDFKNEVQEVKELNPKVKPLAIKYKNSGNTITANSQNASKQPKAPKDSIDFVLKIVVAVLLVGGIIFAVHTKKSKSNTDVGKIAQPTENVQETSVQSQPKDFDMSRIWERVRNINTRK